MEIFLKFYLGFLLVIAVVVVAAIRMNRCGAQHDAQLKSSHEHESDAMSYPRHEA